MTDTQIERWESTRYPGEGLWIRPGTSDEKAAKEVIDRNAYQKPRKGFTLQAGDRWLDAGANIGAFTWLACHLGADVVVAVEPLPDHLQMLYHNAVGLPVVVIEGVVADVPGVVPIHVRPPAIQWRSSMFPGPKDVDVVMAQATTVQSLVGAFHLDCVKLDVEGAEIAILEGWVPPDGVRKIAWEWGFDVDPSVGRFLDVVRRLRAFGFTVDYHSRAGQIDQFPEWKWWPWGIPCFAWR